MAVGLPVTVSLPRSTRQCRTRALGERMGPRHTPIPAPAAQLIEVGNCP